MAPLRRPTTATLLTLSAVIQLALLGYASYIDAHPEKFGQLKYTDVDWRVVADGLAITASPTPSQRAQGWLTRQLGLPLGSPYERATFRYTPLLVLALAPGLIAPIAGRLVLVALTLALPPVLLSGPDPADFWKVHLLWTLNPIVLNITTRGSPEALPCLLTAALVVALRRAGLGWTTASNAQAIRKAKTVSQAHAKTSREQQKWEDISAVLLATAASYKIYPVIYVPAIWAALASKHGWFGVGVWRFGIVTAFSAVLINGALWLLWGQPFLEHTFLYHLSRLDHRHNFSPYFLQIYLSLTDGAVVPAYLHPVNASSSTVSTTNSAVVSALSGFSQHLTPLLSALRHPLASFLPQFVLVLAAGFALTPAIGIEAAMFFQTAVFVVFNKVCTSQYFLWPLPLVPLLSFPRLSWTLLLVLLAAWIGAQALWLSTAYRLEFLGEAVYLPLWGAGVVLFCVSVAALGKLLDVADVREKGNVSVKMIEEDQSSVGSSSSRLTETARRR